MQFIAVTALFATASAKFSRRKWSDENRDEKRLKIARGEYVPGPGSFSQGYITTAVPGPPGLTQKETYFFLVEYH